MVEKIGMLQVGKALLNGETNRPENNFWKIFEIIIG